METILFVLEVKFKHSQELRDSVNWKGAIIKVEEFINRYLFLDDDDVH